MRTSNFWIASWFCIRWTKVLSILLGQFWSDPTPGRGYLPAKPMPHETQPLKGKLHPPLDAHHVPDWDVLPADLQAEVLRHVQWSARATCSTFRTHGDAVRTALHLRCISASTSLALINLRSVLAQQSQLVTLKARGCPMECLSTLPLTQLTSLDLNNSHRLRDVTPLGDCKQLTYLNLSCCERITDISCLASCQALTSVKLVFCTGITSFTALGYCTALRSLNFRSCCSISDIAPVRLCTALTELNLQG